MIEFKTLKKALEYEGLDLTMDLKDDTIRLDLRSTLTGSRVLFTKGSTLNEALTEMIARGLGKLSSLENTSMEISPTITKVDVEKVSR